MFIEHEDSQNLSLCRSAMFSDPTLTTEGSKNYFTLLKELRVNRG